MLKVLSNGIQKSIATSNDIRTWEITGGQNCWVYKTGSLYRVLVSKDAYTFNTTGWEVIGKLPEDFEIRSNVNIELGQVSLTGKDNWYPIEGTIVYVAIRKSDKAIIARCPKKGTGNIVVSSMLDEYQIKYTGTVGGGV